MKIGCVYSDSPIWPKMRWVHESLMRLGHAVTVVRTTPELITADLNCDLILFQHKNAGMCAPDVRNLAKQRHAVWVQWWFDLIVSEPSLPIVEQLQILTHLATARSMDLVCVKEMEWLSAFHDAGINAVYLDQGFPDTMPACVRSPAPKWDVLLFGQSGEQYRQRFSDVLALTQAGYRVAWAGATSVPAGVEVLPWTHPDDLPSLCGQASCVLCVDVRDDINGFCSDRLWLALGMGCCVLKRFSPGLPSGPYCSYRSSSELLNHVHDLLERAEGAPGDLSPGSTWPPKVLQMGNEAREWCLKNHSIDARVQELLGHVATARERAA